MKQISLKFKELVAFMLLISFTLLSAHAQPIKVACVGNSITYGAGIPDREVNSYPAQLQAMLGSDYEVMNFGYSARTLLMKGDRPYMKEQMFQDALNYQPDCVVIKLGTNDSKPHNWEHKADFEEDLRTLIQAFKNLESKPQIIVCLPAKVYGVSHNIYDHIIVTEIIPKIRRVAKKERAQIINLHAATDNMPESFKDNVHPDADGAGVIAREVYSKISKLKFKTKK